MITNKETIAAVRHLRRIYAPMSFRVIPANGAPEHLITVTRYRDIQDAVIGIAEAWRRRGCPVRVILTLQ